MLWILNIALVILLLFIAVAVVQLKDLMKGAILLSGHGLLMGVLFTRLNSPDIALIYVAICVCITTLMLVITIHKTTGRE